MNRYASNNVAQQPSDVQGNKLYNWARSITAKTKNDWEYAKVLSERADAQLTAVRVKHLATIK